MFSNSYEIFEFNNKDADLQRSQVLYRVRRQWLHPLGAGDLWRVSRLAAIEQNLALLIPPDKMAEAEQVSDPTASMSVQRNYIFRSNAGVKNAHALVLQQQSMVGRRRQESIERVWPRPVFRVRKSRILAHGYGVMARKFAA